MNDELNNNSNAPQDYQPAAVPEGEEPFTPAETEQAAVNPVAMVPPAQPNRQYEANQQFNGQPYIKYYPPVKPKSNNMAIAALILGIAGIICSCCCGFGFIFGILALIFGIISISKKYSKSGMGIAGIVLGAVSVIASLAVIVSVVVSWPTIINEYEKVYDEYYSDYYDYYGNGGNYGTNSYSGGYKY